MILPISLMNRYSAIFLLFFAINEINAQSPVDNLYYTGEITAGNYLGIDIDVNYLLREKYSFKLGYSGHLREPRSAPYDYSSGFFQTISFGLKSPYDQLGNYHIMAGKLYPLNKKGSVRLNLSLGLGLAVVKEPTNWQQSERGLLYKNYSFDYNKYYTLGLVINPKFEFPFTTFYGLTISPMVQINKDRTYVGIGIGQMVGSLRKENPEND